MKYTAEDFAQATLATRGEFEFARRAGVGRFGRPWAVLIGDDRTLAWCHDDEMANGGWTPVVESRITEHTLRDAQEKADRKREKLVRHIASLDAVIRSRNEQIERQATRLRKAEGRIEELSRERSGLAVDQAPLSLPALAAAWEAAEQADSRNVGDVLIQRGDSESFLVWRSTVSSSISGNVRILSRATCVPWQDLADVLADMGHLSPTGHAKELYERGVRVTGGETSG